MIGYDEQRKTYYVQYKFKDPVTDKWHTTKKRGFKLKREAKEYEAKMISESKAHTPSLKITFWEMNLKYEESEQLSYNTINSRHSIINKYFSTMKDKEISSISYPKIENWRIAMIANKSLITSTKNRYIDVIKSVFNYASSVYGIETRNTKIRDISETDEEKMKIKEKPVWTVEEFNKFISFIDEPIYKLYFIFLFWSGARKSEGIGLQKKDFDGRYVNIHCQWNEKAKKITPTKTKKPRIIELDSKTCELLKPLLKEKGNFLFGGEIPLTVYKIDSKFKEAKEKAGLNDAVTIHCLRHSHATLLINNNVNIVAVSKRLGHANINTTLSTYAHLFKSTNEELIQTINCLRE